NPHLAAAGADDGTPDFGSVSPDDLRVVAAGPATAAGARVEIGGLGCPVADDFGGGGGTALDLEEILAVGGLGIVAEAVLCDEGGCPVAGNRGETIGPGEGRNADSGSDDVVGVEHLAGEVARWLGCGGGGGCQDREPELHD